MSNTNCLEGMSCPACGSSEPFRIEVSTMADFWDAGSADPYGDMAWSDGSYCECLECHHAATIGAFRLAKPLAEGDGSPEPTAATPHE